MSQTDPFSTIDSTPKCDAIKWKNMIMRPRSYQITQEHSQYMHRLFDEASCKGQGQSNVKTTIYTVNWKLRTKYRRRNTIA